VPRVNRVNTMDKQPSILKDRFSTALNQETKEVNWYGIRFNNLPTMEAILVAAAAFLSDKTDHRSILMFLFVCIGLITSLMSLLAMACNSLVMRMWLKHLRTLVDEDALRAPEDQELQDQFPLGRRPPDLLHFLSVDLPAYGIPICFVVLWGVWFWLLSTH
jgi:hypothetical protein